VARQEFGGTHKIEVGDKENVMRMRICTAGLVLSFLASSGFAIIGPPTAGLDKGRWNGGFSYSYFTQDLDDMKAKWTWLADGAFDSAGTTKVEISDFSSNLYYGGIGYGISNVWQVYVQLGFEDLKLKGDPGTDTRYFEDGKFSLNLDNDFAYGWGTRYTFAEQDDIDLGVAFQMNWFDTCWSGTGTDGTETWKETADIDVMEIIVAVGPTVDMGGWMVYGGPFYYSLSGDADATHRTIATTGIYWSGEASGDLETDSNFGGYIGAQCDIYKNWNMAIELLGTGNGWGIGAGIEVPF